MNIFNFFKKSSNETNVSDNNMIDQHNNFNGVKSIKNWYENRSDNIIIQRNILLFLSFLLVILTILSILVVIFVVNSRTFDPFVIQVDNTTGVTTIVNPISSDILNGNDALAQYFIKKYVTARETYNPVDFDNLARKTISLLSSSQLYYSYIGYIRNKSNDPLIKYGQQNTTFLVVKSWSKVANDKYILRFSINETDGEKRTYDKIAVISFNYQPMELSDSDRDINPVGFQVIGYRVDNDNS
jgi:type IV secretion system protein VirB8